MIKKERPNQEDEMGRHVACMGGKKTIDSVLVGKSEG
jgi:hypothetical protein